MVARDAARDRRGWHLSKTTRQHPAAELRAADKRYRATLQIAGISAEEGERILREELLAFPGEPIDARDAARMRILNGEGTDE